MNKTLLAPNKHGLVLACFALIVTTALVLTQCVTKDRIAQNEKAHRQNALAEVLPAQWYDHPLDQFTIVLPDTQSNTQRTSYIARINNLPVAAIITGVAPDGYSGNINLLVGVLKDGTVTGVRVTSHSETPGLGDGIEIQRSNWITSFNGKSLSDPVESQWGVKKRNGDFDQFTGATITPQAVINEVKNTLLFFESEKEQLLQP